MPNLKLQQRIFLIYEDEGRSGFYADRPQYKRMLRDIEGNKIKAVICFKIDRISRRTVDLLNLVQQIDQQRIAFVSVSDRELYTGSRTGKIMISLLSAIADADMMSYFASFDVTVWAEEKDFDGKHGIMAYNKTEQTKQMDTASTALDPKYSQRTSRREIREWIIPVGKHIGIISGADWIKTQNILNDISEMSSTRPKEVSKTYPYGKSQRDGKGTRQFKKARFAN